LAPLLLSISPLRSTYLPLARNGLANHLTVAAVFFCAGSTHLPPLPTPPPYYLATLLLPLPPSCLCS
jgi:hypothetical protein